MKKILKETKEPSKKSSIKKNKGKNGRKPPKGKHPDDVDYIDRYEEALAFLDD